MKDGSQFVDENLHKAVAPAIWAKDHRDEPPRPGASEEDNTWIAAAFRWTRHDPLDQANFNYLIDAGNVLKKLDETWLKPYGTSIRSLKDELGLTEPLESILSRPEFNDAAHELKSLNPHAFPASLSSLVLFLRWKEHFHQRGECVDVMDLAKEVKRFIPAVGIEETAAAVWLIGCFAGHQRVAAAVYAADADSYEWFAGERLEVEKVSLPAADPEEIGKREAPASADTAPLPECKDFSEGGPGASEGSQDDGSDGTMADTRGKPDVGGEEGASDSVAPVTNESVEAEAHGSPPSAGACPEAQKPKDSPEMTTNSAVASGKAKGKKKGKQEGKNSETGGVQSQRSPGRENKKRSAVD